jgi:hypothetical protein
MSAVVHNVIKNEAELIEKILESEDRTKVVETTLQTDEQVIARITDGIYRQPASALRELISNAYDADASHVIIKTDLPRFARITVEDDGQGMTPQVLAHLLLHIGGSAKRNYVGAELGITSAENPTRSPNGRRLIGKIGIGLFSVSQLTHSFQIVTKVKGDRHRTIATVALRQFSEFNEVTGSGPEPRFESGLVKIWRERASDKNSHGTTIVLTAIRPQARDTLRSHEIWSVIEQNENVSQDDEKQTIEPPKYHIGRVDKNEAILKKSPAGNGWCVPWRSNDKPDTAFQKLVRCVWAELSESNPNPQLDRLFDYYLRMIWQLALAVPLPYVDGHLFDEPCTGWTSTYELANTARGAAKVTDSKQTIRKTLGLSDPKDEPGKFDVIVDDLKLARPIKFKGLPSTGHALRKPLVFIGKCEERFAKIPVELSGGPLSFESYLFWTPKIAPTEHQGSLIRIHGSSGTLFDPTFMMYQVAEQNLLRQITCEIFVSEGLDGALNIDRESFNHAHPHSVYITKWLHSALRQLATAQKRAAGEIRRAARAEKTDARVDQIQKIASDVWAVETDDEGSVPPIVELSETGRKGGSEADSYAFSRSSVLGSAEPKTSKAQSRSVILEEKLKAIAQILASYQLLDRLSKRKQEQLLRAIYKILATAEDA